MSTKLIVALDTENLAQAKNMVSKLTPTVKIFKIGAVLFTAYGPQVTKMVLARKAEVFLDLKYHDIPNTVANAVRQAVRLKVKMLTLHTSGKQEMLEAAQLAASQEAKRLKITKPMLLGVTVLTSDKAGTDTLGEVILRAKLAKASKLDGVVGSVNEAAAVRRACGKGFIIVTPGIRPQGAAAADQKRVATPKLAKLSGADYIVVGRPIIEAVEPRQAALGIIKELK